ncbi:PRTRC system ParB family protein [Sphingopyxis sp. J-6]|uniref:PRTRC system ParB family protein n=1 Tax=Sphingopyxis sp. J-6 TaxID=3122054 RepID=UPI0039841BAA
MTEEPTAFPSTLPLSRIQPGPNPRRYFDKVKHDELVASLLLHGWLQPMLVRPSEDGENYTTVGGGRRYRAALEAFGPDADVPVFIRPLTDQETLPAAMAENDIRDDASETEQADAAVRVLADCGGDRAEAAKRLGWSTTKLDRRLALANLSEAVKVALDERRIKVGHAELLAAVPGDKQDKALDTILTAGLDVAKTRELLMRVTQNLAAATFDKSDCTNCEYNSARQCALFESHVDDGHCTNPGCFQLKTEAAEQARAAATTEKPETSTGSAETTTPPADPAPSDDQETPPAEPAAAPAAKPAPTPAAPKKTAVTAASIATRFADVRETAWRAAVARVLEINTDHARVTIIAAALSGTLGDIKPDSLTARAWLLVNEKFPRLDFRDRIDAVRDLAPTREREAMGAIATAYAKHAVDFGHVAAIAEAFDIDLRDTWKIDQPFLAHFGKDELKFIAQECGLIAHLGEKAFAKLLKNTTDRLADGMLNATGFDWSGHLPSVMTLDGAYSPPPGAPAAEPDPAPEPAVEPDATPAAPADALDAMRKEIRDLDVQPAVVLAKDRYADEPEAFIRDDEGGWSADEGDTGYKDLAELLDNCEIITGHWPTREAYEEFANPTPVPAEPATAEGEGR